MPARLPCPECEADLPQPLEQRGPRVCSQCRGQWFDEQAASAMDDTLPPVSRQPPGAPSRRCPSCEVTLEARRSGDVELGGCPRCLGLFVQAGAIEALRRQQQERQSWAEPVYATPIAQVLTFKKHE
jgi:Zn-finger nucleic acid-binding protein